MKILSLISGAVSWSSSTEARICRKLGRVLFKRTYQNSPMTKMVQPSNPLSKEIALCKFTGGAVLRRQ
jgi:hypothetical protein